jgi:hypothetical protein
MPQVPNSKGSATDTAQNTVQNTADNAFHKAAKGTVKKLMASGDLHYF